MGHRSKRRSVALGLALGLAGTTPGLAQEAPPPVTPQPVTPEGVVAPTEAASREAFSKPPPKSGMMRWGAFEVFPRASGSILYDDNVNIQQGPLQQSDLIWSVSPGAMVMAGSPGVELPPAISFDSLRMLPRQPYIGLDAEPAKMFLLDYAPTIKYFTRFHQYDSVDQSARLTGIYSFSRLTLGLDQDYVKALDTIADVGTRTMSQYITTRLTSKYDLSDRTCIEVNGQYLNASYEDPRFFGSRQWENQNWLDRQIGGKVNAGLGFTLGYWAVDRSPSQTYEQAMARAIYHFAEKLDFTASMGGRWQQYGGGAPPTFDPIFSLAGTYRPVDSTTITLEGHRLQESSPLYGIADYILTGFSAGVRQRLLDKWFVSLNAGYDMAAYSTAVAGISFSRTDNIYSARLGVDYQFTERWTSGVYFLRSSDSSNANYAYTDNQIGLQASWRF